MASSLADLPTPELIQRCLEDEDFAWWHLQQRYWGYLLRSIRYWLAERARDAYLVATLATNVWTSLWGPKKDGRTCGRLAGYKPQESDFATFLHLLAHHEVRRISTRRTREVPAGSLLDAEMPQRRTPVLDAGLTFEEFARLLTKPRQKYFWQELLGQGEGPQTEFTAANAWKLRQRLLELWLAFRQEAGTDER